MESLTGLNPEMHMLRVRGYTCLTCTVGHVDMFCATSEFLAEDVNLLACAAEK